MDYYEDGSFHFYIDKHAAVAVFYIYVESWRLDVTVSIFHEIFMALLP
jgi:hypothetical protein